MRKKSKTYDVFISYSFQDIEVAHRIRDWMEAEGLVPFLASSEDLSSNKQSIYDVMREALVESEALVVATSFGKPSLGMGIEFGAASAWGIPIYVVFDGPKPPELSGMIRGFPVYPLQRIDEVVAAIHKELQALSDEELAILAALYCEYDVPVNRMSIEPGILGRLTQRFNRRTGRNLSGERLLRVMMRLRKSGKWPRLQRRAQPTHREQ